MRISTYVVAILAIFAWAVPIAFIAAILSGSDGVFGILLSAVLHANPPYGRVGTMVIGLLCSLVAPIWLRSRGHSQWALGSAVISLAVALVFVYGPVIVASVQTGR